MSGEALGFDLTVKLHAGHPHPSIVERALQRLLDQDRPAISFTAIPGSKVRVPKQGAARAVAEAWAADGNRAFEVSAEGTGHSVTMVVIDRAGDFQGTFNVGWSLDPSLSDDLTGLLVDLADLLCSPLAVLSHQGSWRQRTGWRSRVGSHQLAVREADRPGPGQYSLSRGLAGLAHRTVLGPELVAMLGEERLARLPASQAERRGDGRWLLSTTDDPLDWTFERWCPEEAAVIEALGPEHFFDPETGRLPTVMPTLPPLAPYRCSYLEPDTNERVEHDPEQQEG